MSKRAAVDESQDASSSTGSSGGVSSENCEGDDDEPSSSYIENLTLGSPLPSNEQSSQIIVNVEEALSTFREQWQRELTSPNKSIDKQFNENKESVKSHQTAQSDEEIAKSLFLKGADHERNGELYEAIKFYKRAVQLVPDIEMRIYESTKIKNKPIEESHDKTTEIYQLKDVENKIKNYPKDMDLTANIKDNMLKNGGTCTPEYDDKSTHISSLPNEIIMYILRWVVSNELDMISLERFAAVCRAFYLYARDPEIWRLACIRTWGIHCATYKALGYLSWRHMFIERPRLKFNGCYISKTSYVRPGENSFQDQFYRPWHLVKYFRYLRFFPDSVVLMMTTPDEPITCLDRLKQRNSKIQGVLSGHYRLNGDKVNIVVGKAIINQNKQFLSTNSRFKSRRKENIVESSENTFHLELQLKSHSPQMFCSLVWRTYNVLVLNRNNGGVTASNFEIVKNKFPSFKFFQVGKYHAKSEYPLQ